MRGAALLALILPAIAGAGTPLCDVKEEDLKPTYKGKAIELCPSEDACRRLLIKIEYNSSTLRSIKESTCQDQKKYHNDLAQLAGKDTYYDQTLRVLNGAKTKYDTLSKALNRAYDDMRGPVKIVASNSPAAQGDPAKIKLADIARTVDKRTEFAALQEVPKPTRPAEVLADPHKSRFAVFSATHFMKSILNELEEIEKAKAQLAASIDTVTTHQKNAKTPRDNPPDNRGTGGKEQPSALSGALNPATLMGLASAAAGLAGMMKKPDPAVAENGTSPTPPSAAASQAAGPTVSKFDSEKTPKANGVGMANSVNTATEAVTESAYLPSGSALAEESSISGSEASLNQSTPATSKAPGGGSSGGGTDDSSAPATRDLSAVGPPAMHDEAMQGIGAGGLGGGGGQSAAGYTDPATAAAEESMKDLLTEMKETAEAAEFENNGLGESQADSALKMNNEDLFPRVRAAHVRFLKQGRVLNGLGEQIDPEAE